MSWSLGEIGALATKAARGGGMDWGIGPETGVVVLPFGVDDMREGK